MDTLNRPATWIMDYDVRAALNPAGYEFSVENNDNETVCIGVIDNASIVRTRAMIDLAVAMLSKRGYKTRRVASGTMLRVRKG